MDLLPPDINFSFVNTVQAEVTFSYHHAGFRVIDWGIPEINGNTIHIDTQIIEWDGPAPWWNTTLRHTYDFGRLNEGEGYTIIFKEWGTTINEVAFIAESPVDIDPIEPGWQEHTTPMLTMEQITTGTTTHAILTASFFENTKIAHMVQSWGEVIQAGSVFTVNPVFLRNSDTDSESAVRFCSYTYRLGELDVGSYTFRVVARGEEIFCEDFEIVVTVAPLPTIQPLPTTAPETIPLVRVDTSVDKLTNSQGTFEIRVKNYGGPCFVETHPFLTDPFLSITPDSATLGLTEEAVFTVDVYWYQLDWAQEITSYNAFVVTDSHNYREYSPWEIILDNSDPSVTPEITEWPTTAPTPEPTLVSTPVTTPDPTQVPTPEITEPPACENPSGDVNDDGTTDIIDALLIAQYYVGIDPPNFQPANGDVDLSGTIDIIDALLVAQLYVGLISEFPGC